MVIDCLVHITFLFKKNKEKKSVSVKFQVSSRLLEKKFPPPAFSMNENILFINLFE